MSGTTSRLVCPRNCGKSYAWKTNLYKHLTFECGIRPQFKCPYCSKVCNRKSNLRTHVLCVHKVIFDKNIPVFPNNLDGNQQ